MNALLVFPLPPSNGSIARWSETKINYCRNNSVRITNVSTSNNVQELRQRTKLNRYIYQAAEEY